MSFCFLNESAGRSLNRPKIPLVFIPGWGFDARIVSVYNLFRGKLLIVPSGFVHPAKTCSTLLSFLDEKAITQVNIVGWSMGANVGLEFTCANSDRVVSLDLLSLRSTWPKNDVDDIRQGIREGLPDYMKGFYRKCFLGYKKEYRDFTKQLQGEYLHEIQVDTLVEGLDYLEQFTLPAIPGDVEIQVIHGAKDIIAPAEERAVFPGIKETLFPNAGHGVLFEYGKSIPAAV